MISSHIPWCENAARFRSAVSFYNPPFLPASRPRCHTNGFWGKHPWEANSSEQGWGWGTVKTGTAQTQVSLFFKSQPVLTFERLQLIKKERGNSEQFPLPSPPKSGSPNSKITPTLQQRKHMRQKITTTTTEKNRRTWIQEYSWIVKPVTLAYYTV